MTHLCARNPGELFEHSIFYDMAEHFSTDYKRQLILKNRNSLLVPTGTAA